MRWYTVVFVLLLSMFMFNYFLSYICDHKCWSKQGQLKNNLSVWLVITLLTTAKHWFKDKEKTNPTKSLDLIGESFWFHSKTAKFWFYQHAANCWHWKIYLKIFQEWITQNRIYHPQEGFPVLSRWNGWTVLSSSVTGETCMYRGWGKVKLLGWFSPYICVW